MTDFVEVYEFIKPDVDVIEGLIMEACKDCKYNCFKSINKWCYIYKIKFVVGKNIRKDNFVVNSDDISIK